MSNRFGIFRYEALLIRMLSELGKDKPLMKIESNLTFGPWLAKPKYFK